MNMLENKIIVVTGGSLGIGFAVSKKIAIEGGTVIMFARNKQNLMNAKNQLKKISNKNHDFFVGDVSNLTDTDLFSMWIKNKYSEINGLVNCAGVYGPIGKTTEIKNMKEFLDTIKINFMGTINMCNSLCNSLYNVFSAESKRKIVNFSGGGASSPFPNYSAYSASKVALVRFTENLSIELYDDNFEVNCIAPGFVNTRLHQKTLEAGYSLAGNAFYENTKKQLEEGLSTPPEKAADLCAFLLSEKSNGINGKFISAVWDDWLSEDFKNLLISDKDFCTLRRIDNKTFYKK